MYACLQKNSHFYSQLSIFIGNIFDRHRIMYLSRLSCWLRGRLFNGASFVSTFFKFLTFSNSGAIKLASQECEQTQYFSSSGAKSSPFVSVSAVWEILHRSIHTSSRLTKQCICVFFCINALTATRMLINLFLLSKYADNKCPCYHMHGVRFRCSIQNI